MPALGEAATQLDVATTTAASELIVRSLQSSGSEVSHLINHINQALEGGTRKVPAIHLSSVVFGRFLQLVWLVLYVIESNATAAETIQQKFEC